MKRSFGWQRRVVDMSNRKETRKQGNGRRHFKRRGRFIIKWLKGSYTEFRGEFFFMHKEVPCSNQLHLLKTNNSGLKQFNKKIVQAQSHATESG